MLYFVLLLLIVYCVIAIAVGIFGRAYLKCKEKRKLELYATKVNYLLVLSSFALIALIYLMGSVDVIFENHILAFFATSFIIFILAFKLTDFEYHNLVFYLIDSLTDLGLLTLAGGFALLLVRISHFIDIIFYSGLLIIFALIIYGKIRWYKYMKIIKGGV